MIIKAIGDPIGITQSLSQEGIISDDVKSKITSEKSSDQIRAGYLVDEVQRYMHASPKPFVVLKIFALAAKGIKNLALQSVFQKMEQSLGLIDNYMCNNFNY